MPEMLSRIADSLFWMARYIERAEDTARILDVNYHMMLEQSDLQYRLRWEPLIRMAGEEKPFQQLYTEANAYTVFDFLAFRADNPSSIVQCIAKARENARTIRERISREMWEDINGLYHTVNRFDAADEIAAGPHRFCDAVKFGCHRFHGVTTPRCRTMKAGNSCESAGRWSGPRPPRGWWTCNIKICWKDLPCPLPTITNGWRCCDRWAPMRLITASTSRPSGRRRWPKC